jgi:[ribosomal protein S18]-alanine N-acetyltransferase
MLTTINIEITRTPDTQALAALHNACFDKPWNACAIADLLQVADTVAFMASQDGLLQGFGLLRCTGGEADILTLAVPSPYRRRGTGKALLARMCEEARRQQTSAIFLDVRQTNYAAQTLYAKAGFSFLSRRRWYYRNTDGSAEDAVIMRLQL